jgi:mannose-6-phosphate isomerase-like protein (cupin superfamily)
VKTISAALLALVAVTGNIQGQSEAAMLSQSKVFAFGDLKVRKMANGGESRDVATGVLATGEAVSIHESMQPEGLPPNPAHSIDHSEFIIVQEGTLEYRHDGIVELAGPGSVIYVALGTMHAVKNVGQGPAKYAVISIGGDVKK